VLRVTWDDVTAAEARRAERIRRALRYPSRAGKYVVETASTVSSSSSVNSSS